MKNRIQKMNLKITWRLALMLLTVLLGMNAARAATLTVTNTSDAGAGSLRQAILDAAAGDTINFAVSGTITLTTGELVIDKDLNIVGPGANQLTISGNNLLRVFFINPGASGATTGPPVSALTVSISNLTIADGRAKGGNGGFCRGGGGGGVGGDGSTSSSGFGGFGGNLGGGYASPGNSGDEGGGGGTSDFAVGNGGFGGGGDSTTVIGGTSGVGGIFGGSGGANIGGGGAGLGGGIFVRAGSLNLSNAVFNGNKAIGGAGANYGLGKGAGVFLLDGVTAVSSNISFDLSETSTVACTPTDNPDVYGSLGGYDLVPRADSLTFTQEPARVSVNSPINPAVRVQILDQCRTPFSNADTISIAFGNNPTGAFLGGTLSRVAVAGVATFDDLTINTVGEGYTLTATDPLLRVPGVTTQPFFAGILNPVVTNTNDGGSGSLRQAIFDAAAGETITFAPELAGASIPLSTAASNAQGQSALLVERNLTIDGSPGGITITRDTTNPNLSLRLFFVQAGATLRLRHLTLSDGYASGGDGGSGQIGGGGGAGLGGAIYNAGTLVLENAVLTGNRAVGGRGGDRNTSNTFGAGGFPNGGGPGGAGGFGGGGGGNNVNSRRGSQFGGGSGGSGRQFNGGGGGGGAGLGGAVFNDNGSLIVVNSTFSGNSADGGSGGNRVVIASFTNADGGAGLGGGLFSLNSSVRITNSTFANNSDSGGSPGTGGIQGAMGAAQTALTTATATTGLTAEPATMSSTTATATTPSSAATTTIR